MEHELLETKQYQPSKNLWLYDLYLNRYQALKSFAFAAWMKKNSSRDTNTKAAFACDTLISYTPWMLFYQRRWVDFETGALGIVATVSGWNYAFLTKQETQIKKKTAGSWTKVSSQPVSLVGWASKWVIFEWENRMSDIQRNHLSLASLSLTLLLTDLSFHSCGSLSLFWIPTVFYITDSASVTVKHTVPGCV